MKKRLFAIVLIFSYLTLSPSNLIAQIVDSYTKTYKKPLSKNENVLIAMPEDEITVGFQKLGTIIHGSSNPKAGFSELTEAVKQAAREAGGNLVKVLKFTPKKARNDNYELQGFIYYTDSLEYQKSTPIPVEQEFDADYAMIHFYRYPDKGPKIEIKTLDSILCTISPATKQSIHLKKQSKPIIIAQTKKRKILTQEFEPGKEYFVRAFARGSGAPKLELMSWLDGKMEYMYLNMAQSAEPENTKIPADAAIATTSATTINTAVNNEAGSPAKNTNPPAHTSDYTQAKSTVVKKDDIIISAPKTSSTRGWINIAFGPSWYTAKNPEGLASAEEDHMDALKKGFHFEITAAYFVNPSIGIGFTHNRLSTSQTTNITGEVEGQNINLELKEDIFTSLTGPVFLVRTPITNSKSVFYSSLALGLLSYGNEAITSAPAYTSATKSVKRNGDSFGGNIAAGIDIGIIDDFAINAQLSYLFGNLSKVTINSNGSSEEAELEGDNKINASRLSIGIGVSFRF